MNTVRRAKQWRIDRMGRFLVLHMHGRWAKLFTPISWEYTHHSDVDLLEHEALCIVSGRYDRLYTSIVRKQCESVPAMIAGVN